MLYYNRRNTKNRSAKTAGKGSVYGAGTGRGMASFLYDGSTDDLYVCIPEIRENQIQVQMEFVRNTKMESDVQATTVICENKIEDRAQIGSDGEIKPENMDTEKSVYGIAIDIGTTTLAAELISLTDGICLKTASSVNHQRAYGADVISRIRAAASGDAES